MKKSNVFSDLKPGSHIHLMGVCGTAMGSLAGILKEMGFKVTGSDQNVYPPMSTQLEELGVEIMSGYKKENLEPRPDLVVVGNVIQKIFEEAQALLESDIPYTSLPEAMGEYVIADRKSIVVAGTHGKTTTTSMMSWVAQECSMEPGYLIGGIPKNWGRSFRVPKGDVFVIEGDEYDTAFFAKVPKFIYYKPKFVILTSIEFDHADIYNSIEDIKDAFKQLLVRIPKDGVLVANADSPLIVEMLSECKGKVITYGERGQYSYNLKDKKDGRTVFDITRFGETVCEVNIGVYGQYNIENALASFALANEMGWEKESVLEGLKTFTGVKRRQETIGEPGGVTVIDDFAHHPTAVRMTIEGIQSHFPGRKVFSIFEPRSATSRRKVFEKEYIEAFKGAQCLLMAKPFDQSRIPEEDRFSAENVMSELKQSNVDSRLMENSDEIAEYLKNNAKPNDVVLIMSNGGFDGLYDKLLDKLSAEKQ